MVKKEKTFHETFARFFEEPSRETLRDLLTQNLGEVGACDFKETIPSHQKLSKHLLAIGNSGGGCIVLGVKENEDKTLTSIGLGNLYEKTNITNGVKKYIPPALLDLVEIGDFSYKASEYPDLVGKNFQVIYIKFDPEVIPFVSMKEGQDIMAPAIYVRRGTGSEVANFDELQNLIKIRLEAGGISPVAQNLKEHLNELKTLYNEIPKTLVSSSPFVALSNLMELISNPLAGERKQNPNFPKENYQEYVRELLDKKKILIEKSLGLGK